ncbi:MAG: TolC family protein [Betaproteobacteria bacterium]|nr:TolC family protein [Betaproteobacteria bacterium]
MRTATVAMATLLLAGCATFSEDGGFGTVQRTVKERTGQDARWVRTDDDANSVRARTREILGRPLTADDAVQLALLNNPGLQATYAELGISEADLVQAGRGPNLRLHWLRTKFGNDVTKVEESFSFDLLGVLLMPLRQKMEARRFERVQADVTAEVIRVASETRKAWVHAVAAAQAEHYMGQVKDAADAGSELARRMAAVGNWSKLNQMREQAFYADAAAQLARARNEAHAARERFARLAGLWGEDLAFRLPERLSDLPAAPRDGGELEARAMEQRLDVRAAKREAEWVAESLGLTKATRFINALELGRARTKEGQDGFSYGYVVGVEIPIFDWGTARVARAEATYMQAAHRVAQVAIDARSEVRELYGAYRTAYDLTRHYRDEVVPLRKRISDEMLLRYNGMLASVFELLADSREQVAAVNSYLGTLREFWIADAELQASLSGRAGGGMAAKSADMPSLSMGGRGH